MFTNKIQQPCLTLRNCLLTRVEHLLDMFQLLSFLQSKPIWGKQRNSTEEKKDRPLQSCGSLVFNLTSTRKVRSAFLDMGAETHIHA